MAGYYSILRFVNNPLADESIALGLVILPEPESGKPIQALFRISETKLDFAKRLNPKASKLLVFALKQLELFFKQDLLNQTNKTVEFPVKIQHDFIKRLSAYNNGIIQFSEPIYIESAHLASAYNRYFDRFVEANTPQKSQEEVELPSLLKQRVATELYEPLRGKIDVDYTLRKKQLPSLYFDYHLDGLGVNGAVYAVKAIDLNANHHLDTLQRDISEFESVIDRLDRFAKDHNIKGEPHYYLIVDPYKGNNKDRKELFDILKSTDQFMLKTSEKLSQITAEMKKRGVGKFTDKLQEG